MITIWQEETMDAVFIAHAKGDRYFVTLFTALLTFHSIDVLYCLSHDEEGPGVNYSDDILEALAISNTFIIINSHLSHGAPWIEKDIALFKKSKPEGTVVFALLDPPIPGDQIPETYKTIDFSSCMLTGYLNFFNLMGKQFLEYPDRRKTADRRERQNVDRRKSPLIQRMRRGFWLGYSSVSGYGKFDPVNLDHQLRYKMMDALDGESKRYEFFDKNGSSRSFKSVLEDATQQVWAEMKKKENVKAVIVVEAVAEKIYNCFDVKPKDQRKEPRRKSDEY